MSFFRLWVLLGCLGLWGAGSPVPAGQAKSDSGRVTQSWHGPLIKHAVAATADDLEASWTEQLSERLRPQEHTCAAPHWQGMQVPTCAWLIDCAPKTRTRRATAPLLVGIVELLI